MMNKYFFIVGLVAFWIGVVCGILLFCIWPPITPSFYDIKVTEIVQILSTIGVAVFVTRAIQDGLHDKLKRKELILELFDKLSSHIKFIHDEGNVYMEENKSNNKICTKILSDFRSANNILSLINDIDNSKNIFTHFVFDDALIAGIRELKRILTIKHFKEENPNYSEDIINAFNDMYDKMQVMIYKGKIKVYS